MRQRNFLPYHKQEEWSKRLKKRFHSFSRQLQNRRVRPWLITGVLVLSSGAILLGGMIARAAFNTNCTNDYGGLVSAYLPEWDNQGFHYQIRRFSTGTNSAAFGNLFSSATCTGWAGGRAALKENVNTTLIANSDTKGYTWFGTRVVGIRLGAPNQGAANNYGIWDTSGFSAAQAPFYRPPVYARNWNGPAASVDDGGLAGIESPRFGIKHSIWCWGVGDARVGADGYQDCDPWANGLINDPSTFPQGDARTRGAGAMFTYDNCHFGDQTHLSTAANGGAVIFLPRNLTGFDYFHDYNDSGGEKYPSDGSSVQCSDSRNWIWYYDAARPAGFMMNDTAHNLNGATQNMDLSNFIGCKDSVGNWKDCDEISDPIESFNLRQYNRNTVGNLSGTQTFLTFKYPIIEHLKMAKSPNDNYYHAGTPIPYQVQVSRDKFAGRTGNVATVTVTDVLGPHQSCDATCVSSMKFGATPVTPDAGYPQFDNATGKTTIKWSFSSVKNTPEWAFLNSKNPAYFYISFNAGTDPTFNGDVTNDVSATGTNLFTGLATTGGDDVQVLNHLYTDTNPYLTTSGGDVRAAGFSVNCAAPAGSGNVKGGGDPTNIASKGDYIVSAGGSVSNFGSNNNPSGSTLTISGYKDVCRPDLVNQANNFSGQSVSASDAASTVADLQDPANSGKIVKFNGNLKLTTCPVISMPVTLFITSGTLELACDITYNFPPGGAAANKLPALGVIVNGDINIDPPAHQLWGYYYAKGIINTCNVGAAPSAATLASQCASTLTVNGLMSAQRFSFYRIGSTTVGNQPAEVINYLGLYFIAPPPVFNGALSTLPPSFDQYNEGRPIY